MSYDAKIILDSVGPNGARLTTFELTYPRFVHSELLTHRMLSRNSASSRAIPVERLLDRIENSPVTPVWWGKNQAGMQAREELDGTMLSAVRSIWQGLSRQALTAAREMAHFGLHKQIANRVVEPWMFITTVVTATEWANFFALRDHPDAQPEIAKIAAMAHELYRASDPRKVEAGCLHLPYVTDFDETKLRERLAADITADGVVDPVRYGEAHAVEATLAEIAIGRCAAVSYLNQDKQTPKADRERAAKMEPAGHMSPFEHVATALSAAGWNTLALSMADAWWRDRVPVGNLWGWAQWRKGLENEHDFSQRSK